MVEAGHRGRVARTRRPTRSSRAPTGKASRRRGCTPAASDARTTPTTTRSRSHRFVLQADLRDEMSRYLPASATDLYRAAHRVGKVRLAGIETARRAARLPPRVRLARIELHARLRRRPQGADLEPDEDPQRAGGRCTQALLLHARALRRVSARAAGRGPRSPPGPAADPGQRQDRAGATDRRPGARPRRIRAATRARCRRQVQEPPSDRRPSLRGRPTRSSGRFRAAGSSLSPASRARTRTSPARSWPNSRTRGGEARLGTAGCGGRGGGYATPPARTERP